MTTGRPDYSSLRKEEFESRIGRIEFSGQAYQFNDIVTPVTGVKFWVRLIQGDTATCIPQVGCIQMEGQNLYQSDMITYGGGCSNLESYSGVAATLQPTFRTRFYFKELGITHLVAGDLAITHSGNLTLNGTVADCVDDDSTTYLEVVGTALVAGRWVRIVITRPWKAGDILWLLYSMRVANGATSEIQVYNAASDVLISKTMTSSSGVPVEKPEYLNIPITADTASLTVDFSMSTIAYNQWIFRLFEMDYISYTEAI